MMLKIKKQLLENYNLNLIEMNKIEVESINEIYLCVCEEKNVILKEISSPLSFNRLSLYIQNYLNKDSNLSPAIILNNNGGMFDAFDRKIIIVQEYVEQVDYGAEKIFDICELLKILHNKLKKIYISNNIYRRTYEEINTSINNYSYLTSDLENSLVDIRSKYNQKFKTGYNPLFFANIHGDFKKDNVLLQPDNTFKIIDFDYTGYKDVDVEICRAACEFSGFNSVLFLSFLKNFFCNDEKRINLCIKNYLSYLIASDFPFNIKEKVKRKYYEFLIYSRIKLFEFILNEIQSGGFYGINIEP